MTKQIVRTEAAPAPFQGAPYSQAVVRGRPRLRLGAARRSSRAPDGVVPGGITEQTEQVFDEPRRRSSRRRARRSTGSSRRPSSSRTSTTSPAMNEVYARYVGERAARARDGRGREAPVRRARRDRGDRDRLEPPPLSKEIEEYVGSLGLDAYVVGGAVRDELLGIDVEGRRLPRSRRRHRRPARRAALRTAAPRRSSSRGGGRRAPLSARPSARRKLCPRGIELAPPRREVSTGPGRHDFEIVVDPARSVEDDLARRDFTINAMARRLADGDARRSATAAADDLEARMLRTVSPSELRGGSAAPRPRPALRLAARPRPRRGDARADARGGAARCSSSRGERIGGGLAADGLGELSKLLLGAARARRSGSRATPASSSSCCRSSSPRSASTRRAATTT